MIFSYFMAILRSITPQQPITRKNRTKKRTGEERTFSSQLGTLTSTNKIVKDKKCSGNLTGPTTT